MTGAGRSTGRRIITLAERATRAVRENLVGFTVEPHAWRDDRVAIELDTFSLKGSFDALQSANAAGWHAEDSFEPLNGSQCHLRKASQLVGCDA